MRKLFLIPALCSLFSIVISFQINDNNKISPLSFLSCYSVHFSETNRAFMFIPEIMKHTLPISSPELITSSKITFARCLQTHARELTKIQNERLNNLGCNPYTSSKISVSFDIFLFLHVLC